MADEEMDEAPPAEEFNGSNSESTDESDDSEPVETLIAGRDRRATAGNRMANLIEREDDDEVSLLFAQEDDEEDVEFEGSDEDGSDAQLDSSSDDEDQGPSTKGDEDLEGENELQREAKAQKAKKRKAQDAFTTVSGLRKKVKIDATTTPVATAPRPKKKSERVSWLPDVNDGPTRASARKQTVENKEFTHARLKDHAVKRAKTLAQMKKAEREREKHKPKQMTQADRLAEAAKTEKRNSKSLNRWEETERKRADEQAAKLAALKTRKLEGPVVSWWSGMATWLGTRLVKVGSKETNQEMLAEPKKRGRKPKQNLEAMESVKEDIQSSADTPRDQTVTPAPSEPSVQPQVAASDHAAQLRQTADLTQTTPQIMLAAPQGLDNSFLQGIQEYASMPSEGGSNVPSTTPSDGPGTPQVYVDPSQRWPTQSRPQLQPPPPEPVHSTRNLVMLASFERITPADRGEFSVFYNTRKAPKLSKVNHELCPITSLPARYRDPSTGVAYANSYAYQRLKELQEYRYIWSGMLGCYVGTAGMTARGVPDGFLSDVTASITST
jgi:vacuolar protein sorting-associated protein 72